MSNDIPKRASFGFDADFGDLSTVKPTGQARPKPVEATKPKPKAVRKPKTSTRKAKEAASDKIAQSQGFTSREAAPAPVLMKKRRRVQHDEPVDQLSIRGPVRVLNGFIDYCEANKLSYWEGLERLVGQADQS